MEYCFFLRVERSLFQYLWIRSVIENRVCERHNSIVARALYNFGSDLSENTSLQFMQYCI
jgi:hypothetical protein